MGAAATHVLLLPQDQDVPRMVGATMITSLNRQKHSDLRTAFRILQVKTGRSVKDLLNVAVNGRARLTLPATPIF